MKDRKKLILCIVLPLAIVLIAAALLLYFNLRSKGEATPPEETAPAAASHTVPPTEPSAAPNPTDVQPESTPEPTEQLPAITPPASYPVDTASGSDIQLWPVAPASDSDLPVESAAPVAEDEPQTAA